MALSLFGIILGLVLLMFLAYKGCSIIWVAPVCAVVVAVLGGYSTVSYTHLRLTDYALSLKGAVALRIGIGGTDDGHVNGMRVIK